MKIILFLFSLCLLVLTACGQGGSGDTSNVNDPEPTALPTSKPTPNPTPPSSTNPPVIPSPTPSLPPTPTPTPSPTPPLNPTPTAKPPPQSSSFGSIRGTVITSTGSALNAVHVRAINVEDNDIQIGSFSGIDTGPIIKNGAFMLQGVPPGRYRILIERIDGRGNVSPNRLGNFVSSNAPSLIFPDEYYNGSRESANDDPNDFEEVNVLSDQITQGINFITND